MPSYSVSPTGWMLFQDGRWIQSAEPPPDVQADALTRFPEHDPVQQIQQTETQETQQTQEQYTQELQAQHTQQSAVPSATSWKSNANGSTTAAQPAWMTRAVIVETTAAEAEAGRPAPVAPALAPAAVPAPAPAPAPAVQGISTTTCVADGAHRAAAGGCDRDAPQVSKSASGLQAVEGWGEVTAQYSAGITGRWEPGPPKFQQWTAAHATEDEKAGADTGSQQTDVPARAATAARASAEAAACTQQAGNGWGNVTAPVGGTDTAGGWGEVSAPQTTGGIDRWEPGPPRFQQWSPGGAEMAAADAREQRASSLSESSGW